jgi:hypothetical protein
MHVERGLEGWDQLLKLVERQAGQIQELRGTGLHVGELYTGSRGYLWERLSSRGTRACRRVAKPRLMICEAEAKIAIQRLWLGINARRVCLCPRRDSGLVPALCAYSHLQAGQPLAEGANPQQVVL